MGPTVRNVPELVLLGVYTQKMSSVAGFSIHLGPVIFARIGAQTKQYIDGGFRPDFLVSYPAPEDVMRKFAGQP